MDILGIMEHRHVHLVGNNNKAADVSGSGAGLSAEGTLSGASEAQLITLGKAGDSGAMGELFARHYQKYMKVARRILVREADSEDAVQAAYCSVLENLSSFRSEASFSTWVTRIVVNRCLATIREPWRRRAADIAGIARRGSLEDVAGRAPSPEQSAWLAEIANAHTHAVATLTGPLRDPYSLYMVSEIPVAQVARTLGLTLAAAKSRVFRARTAMQKHLAGMHRVGTVANGAFRSDRRGVSNA